MSTRLALVRPPSPRMHEGLVTHIERQPVDPVLAERQWHDYVAALHANGWDTVEVASAPHLPDCAFIEDTMVVFRDVLQMDEVEAKKVKLWAIRSLVEAARKPARKPPS